jgi:ketosteroid isomerase-like protein
MLKRAGLAVVVGACLVLLVTGCVSTGGKSSEADEAAVRAVLQTYAESVTKGDVEMHAALWDEAAIKHKPNAPAIVGIQALRERWKGWALNTTRMVITTQEVVVSGDWAFAHGVYTSESVPKAGGKTTYVDGKFLTVFKREPDGIWRIYADTSSSNVP